MCRAIAGFPHVYGRESEKTTLHGVNNCPTGTHYRLTEGRSPHMAAVTVHLHDDLINTAASDIFNKFGSRINGDVRADARHATTIFGGIFIDGRFDESVTDDGSA